jgi:hypothetical protein
LKNFGVRSDRDLPPTNEDEEITAPNSKHTINFDFILEHINIYEEKMLGLDRMRS